MILTQLTRRLVVSFIVFLSMQNLSNCCSSKDNYSNEQKTIEGKRYTGNIFLTRL